MNGTLADNGDALRMVMIRLADRLDAGTPLRVAAELDHGDDKAAAEIVAADLDVGHPTITWREMSLLHRALFYNRRVLDENLHPHLWRRSYILAALPVISRGDGSAPPWTMSDFHRVLGEIVEALADRLDLGTVDVARDLLHQGEEGLALDYLAGGLERRCPPVSREEWETVRRVLLFFDPKVRDPGRDPEFDPLPRADAILAALPVLDP